MLSLAIISGASATPSLGAYRENPGVSGYRAYREAAADQDIRIPRELAPHSGTHGESYRFDPMAVESVRKMIFG